MSFISLITGNFRKFKLAKAVFVETEAYEKGFSDYYDKNLKPHIYCYEKARKQSLEKSSKRTKIGLFGLIAILFLDYFLLSSQSTQKPIWAVVVILTIIAIMAIDSWASKYMVDYESSVKSTIFPIIISFYGKFQYLPQCDNLITQEIKDSGIIPYYETENSEDYIRELPPIFKPKPNQIP